MVGTDEAFFEDDGDDQAVLDLYNEKSGILDDDDDTEVDLASAPTRSGRGPPTPTRPLAERVPALPVVYSTRAHVPGGIDPNGVLVYIDRRRATMPGLGRQAGRASPNPARHPRAAECSPEPGLASPRQTITSSSVGGRADRRRRRRPSAASSAALGARFRDLRALKRYAELRQGHAVRVPAAAQGHRRDLPVSRCAHGHRHAEPSDSGSGIRDQELADLVIALRDEDRLCVIQDDDTAKRAADHLLHGPSRSSSREAERPCRPEPAPSGTS